MAAIVPDSITVYGKTLPYVRTVHLTTGSPTAVNAVIVVHGSSRLAADHFTAIEDAVALAAKPDVIIIAPQFLRLEDLTAAGASTSTFHYWSNDGWKSGNQSLNGTTSSYAVIDYILEQLGDIALYPSLTQITLAGHGAGGQFMARYAAGTPVPITARAGLAFRFLIANPSSYLYFTAERPVGRSTTEFYVPTQDPSYFNEYKYGLDDLNAYMGDVGVTQIMANYQNRDIDLLLGDDDIYRDSDLDTSTPGDYQGYVRYERGLAYHNHVVDQLGVGHHDVYVVPGVGQSYADMFQSAVGRDALFDFSDVVTPPTPPDPPEVATIVSVAIG